MKFIFLLPLILNIFSFSYVHAEEKANIRDYKVEDDYVVAMELLDISKTDKCFTKANDLKITKEKFEKGIGEPIFWSTTNDIPSAQYKEEAFKESMKFLFAGKDDNRPLVGFVALPMNKPQAEKTYASGPKLLSFFTNEPDKLFNLAVARALKNSFGKNDSSINYASLTDGKYVYSLAIVARVTFYLTVSPYLDSNEYKKCRGTSEFANFKKSRF